jgi:hypothetical protein
MCGFSRFTTSYFKFCWRRTNLQQGPSSLSYPQPPLTGSSVNTCPYVCLGVWSLQGHVRDSDHQQGYSTGGACRVGSPQFMYVSESIIKETVPQGI